MLEQEVVNQECPGVLDRVQPFVASFLKGAESVTLQAMVGCFNPSSTQEAKKKKTWQEDSDPDPAGEVLARWGSEADCNSLTKKASDSHSIFLF